MIIRHADANDAHRIVEISQQDGYGHPLDKESILNYMKQGDIYLIAEENNKPLGVAKLALNEHAELELFVILVKLDEQRKGLGSKLLKKIEKLASVKGNALVLHVRVNNNKAIDFYKKHGFSVVQEIADLYEKGDRHYKMIKNL